MTVGQYASQTQVAASRSLLELRNILLRYGATQFAYAEERGRVQVLFQMQERRICLRLELPTEAEFALAHNGRQRTVLVRRRQHAQAIRTYWRALVLLVKAKCEAVALHVVGFDQAWLPEIVLPSGATVSEWAGSTVARALDYHSMPALLPPEDW